MKKICNSFIIILLAWFSMDMTGFSIGDKVLVEAAWNSIDGVWWLIFLILSIFFLFKDTSKNFLITFIFLWTMIQFFSHWYYTLFGASNEKIISYNEYFKNTYHIFSPKDNMIIPDFYHIVLHILILVNLVCLIFLFLNDRKPKSKAISPK